MHARLEPVPRHAIPQASSHNAPVDSARTDRPHTACHAGTGMQRLNLSGEPTETSVSCAVHPWMIVTELYRRSGLVISREQGLCYDDGFAVPVLMS